MQEKTKDTIRSIYLYLATLIGLVMVVVPTIGLIKTGLEVALLPPEARGDTYNYYDYGPDPWMAREKTIPATGTTPTTTEVVLSGNDLQAYEDWKLSYQQWKDRQKMINTPAINTRRDVIQNISILIGGLFVFLSHGYVLRKEKRKAA